MANEYPVVNRQRADAGPSTGARHPSVDSHWIVRWMGERWVPLTAAMLALPIILVTALGTSYWPGRVFPGFLVTGNGVVPTIGVADWTGPRAGVPFHARIVAVDGRPVPTGRDVYDAVARLPVGSEVRYTFAKGDETFTRVVPTMRFTGRHYWLTVGLFMAFGLLSVGAGVVVAVLQPHTAAARAFLAQGFFTGLFALTATALYNPDIFWLSRVHVLCNAAFPSAFIHLGLVFPEEQSSVHRRRRWIGSAYAVSAILAVWMLHDIYADPPDWTSYYVTCVYTALSIVGLIGLVSFAYWKNDAPQVRPRLHAVLPGLIVGTAAGIYGFLNIAHSGGDFPINFIALAPALFYVSIAYAIVKHDLFDIDALVKQAVIYATLTVGVTLAYAGSVAVLDALVPAPADRVWSTFNIAYLVLVVALFQPLRAGVQQIVDRTFYRGRLDYRQTVGALSAALTSMLDLSEILDRVGATVSEGLHLRSLTVLLWLEDGTALWRYDPASGTMLRAASGTMLRAADAQPYAGLRAELERVPGRPWYAPHVDAATGSGIEQEVVPLRAVLVMPLAASGRVTGALALGPKLSGRVFNGDDLDVLNTLAAQSGIALQNALSYHALQVLNDELERKVRVRTSELEAAHLQIVQTEKMASLGLLVAGVAHEINNPVSLIVGNVEPLRGRLERLRGMATVRDDEELGIAVARICELLDIIGRGAERTAGIVKDLRAFSGPSESRRQLVDLHECIEVTLRLLRPRWADRVVVHRNYGEVPPIDAVPGQINQILMNILANALDAISGSGNVWIATAVSEGSVTLTVRDDGCGIAQQHLDRVFDPFFTTKPMGKGTGLGLAISRGLIMHHGGSIAARSEPGGGAEFTIVLPLRPLACAS